MPALSFFDTIANIPERIAGRVFLHRRFVLFDYSAVLRCAEEPRHLRFYKLKIMIVDERVTSVSSYGNEERVGI